MVHSRIIILSHIIVQQRSCVWKVLATLLQEKGQTHPLFSLRKGQTRSLFSLRKDRPDLFRGSQASSRSWLFPRSHTFACIQPEAVL